MRKTESSFKCKIGIFSNEKKKTRYDTVGTVAKSYRKIVEALAKLATLTHIYSFPVVD
jgi:hypothetical protein